MRFLKFPGSRKNDPRSLKGPAMETTLNEDTKPQEETSKDEGSKASPQALTFTVDSFSNGIAFGQHSSADVQDPREVYGLAIKDSTEVVPLRSRYALHKDSPQSKLERHLMRLSQQGVLRSSTMYFGTTTDPFYPFEGKFDTSIKFLELFQRYTPGMLHIQTRSPLIVIALPVFKKLGKHCAITIGLETPLEEEANRYTPGLPRIEERLKTVRALRRFGVEVNLQVSPLLPYGDWKSDAPAFARLLVEHADHIFVEGLVKGSEKAQRKAQSGPLAQKLAADRKFHWLRHDSANPLITAIEELAPEKLKLPERKHLQDRQVQMFAA